jgi:programmed cell death 6-interacting protein
MQKIEAAQFEDFFERRLQMYNVDKELVPEEDNEQQVMIKRLRLENAQFITARKGDSTSKAREQALQSLENAYYKYKEIISNLDAGRKFYNDLAKIVTRFRDDCKNFTYQRRAEAQEAEADVTAGMSSLNLNKAAALQQQRQAERENAQPAYNARPPAQEPLAAPLPTRATPGAAPAVWSEGIPIRFASGPTANPAPQNGGQQPKDTKWEPSKGLRFS